MYTIAYFGSIMNVEGVLTDMSEWSRAIAQSLHLAYGMISCESAGDTAGQQHVGEDKDHRAQGSRYDEDLV